MRSLHISTLLVGTLVLSIGNTVSAQNRSSDVLNALEVRQLVARAEPGDHARLARHFSALEARYTAEATRHTGMSRGFAGHPSRQLATNLEVHCKQLAAVNTQLAETARELAAYHEKLAAGAPATPPSDTKRLEEGRGAPAPNEQELSAFVEKATVAKDHKALEDYFLTLAKRYSAEADTHTSMASAYRGTRLAPAAVHCDRLVKLAREAAKEAGTAAAMHKELANAKQ